MERLNALGRGAQIMLVGAVLLLIDLFLPWQDFDVGGIAEELGVDVSFSGWRGFAGVVLGLLTIALIAWMVVRLAAIKIPLPVSSAMMTALLGGLILVFAIIKLLTIIGDEATFWSYLGVVLAIVVAFGAWQTVQAAGGIEKLKAEMPSMPSLSSDTAAATAPPAAPPPPVPAPAAPEAASPPETGAPAEAAGESEGSTDREA